MKKQIIGIGILIMLVTVSLSGCQLGSPDDDKSEYGSYVDFNVTRFYTIWTGMSVEDGEAEGFYHDYPSTGGMGGIWVRYRIVGDVTNIGDKPIDSVQLIGKVYDSGGNYLCEDWDYVFELYMDETKEFSIAISKTQCNFFDKVEDYKITVADVDFIE